MTPACRFPRIPAAARPWAAALLFAAAPLAAADPVNVLALGAGALPVVEPASYGGWEPVQLLDDSPDSGWASVEGKTGGQVMVVELPAAVAIERFEFDESCLDGDARGARNVRVGVSDSAKDAGFTTVLEAALTERKNGQSFPASSKVPGRWVRLELLDNHGDSEWIELCSFRGYALPATPPPISDVSGTYQTDYSLFHVRQQGTALTGCYEYDGGLLTGSVEGRVMKIAWQEAGGPDDSGPAVMVFAADGKTFRGHWWQGTDKGRAPSGEWNGTRTSGTVGSCPHWSGSVGGEVERALAATGRALLYGIEFDVDSARIREESKPVLEDVARALAAHPDWRLAIEGHTDSTGSATHNQQLSEARAAAVRDGLTAHGIAAERLTSAGFGASRPVADNATELGRSRNRRVEIVRR